MFRLLRTGHRRLRLLRPRFRPRLFRVGGPFPRDERRFIVFERIFHDCIELFDDGRPALDDTVDGGARPGLLRPDVVAFDERRFKVGDGGAQPVEKIGGQGQAREGFGEGHRVLLERLRVRDQFAVGFGSADDEFLFEVRDGQRHGLRGPADGLHLLEQPVAGIGFEGLLAAFPAGLRGFVGGKLGEIMDDDGKVGEQRAGDAGGGKRGRLLRAELADADEDFLILTFLGIHEVESDLSEGVGSCRIPYGERR